MEPTPSIDRPETPPARLPPRLGDPLLLFRRILVISFVASAGLTLFEYQETSSLGTGLITLAVLFVVWRILPSRVPDAIYLRTFRQDAETLEIRQEIQAGLGRRFRLSGIRDPRRRWSYVARYFLTGLFCFRYATVKYMNLEAGDDWFARLWRNLGEARCAFLDLTDVTTYVEQEIELAYRSLGPSRILFLGSPEMGEAACRDLVAKTLGLDGPARESLRVAVWPRVGGDVAGFRREVAAFAADLPPGPAGPAWDAYPMVRDQVQSPGSRLRGAAMAIVQGVAGTALGLALTFGVTLGLQLAMSLGYEIPIILALIPSAIAYAYVVLGLMVYYHDCGSARERGLLLLSMTTILFGLVASIVPPVLHARSEVRRVQCGSNLWQIGLALQNYESREGCYPPAYTVDDRGRPMHSWRVLILPYLDVEDRGLYEAYNFNQPWDGPDNIRLVSRMPEVYRCPGDRSPDPSMTSYFVVVEPRTAFPGSRCTRISSATDGTSSTIFAVEATGMGIRWTEPRDLDFSRLDTLLTEDPANPRSHERGFQAVFLDGSCRFLYPSRLKRETLRALTTRNGGESLSYDDY